METNNSPQARIAQLHKAKADILQTMYNTSGSIVLCASGQLVRIDPGDAYYQEAKQLIEKMAVYHITSKLNACEGNFQVIDTSGRLTTIAAAIFLFNR